MVTPIAKDSRQQLFRSHRVTLLSLSVVALLGIVLAVEGGMSGSSRHRGFALLSACLLVLPLALTMLVGRRWLRLQKKLAFSVLPLVLLFLLTELVLVALGVRTSREPAWQADPVLGFCAEPFTGELDGWGYRNRAVPKRADVVCIGDSQTYGFGLLMDESYPAQLAARSGMSVYSMSHGGYGPVQYLALAEQAVKLQPRALVIALYFGNDLVDAHTYAGQERWRELRAESQTYAVPDLSHLSRTPSSPNLAMAMLDAVIDHSRIISWTAYRVKARLRANAWMAATYSREVDAPRCERGNIHTFFTPIYRTQAMNLDTPAVGDGLRITQVCLQRITKLCKSHGIQPLLLLIHSKEHCYQQLLHDVGDPAAKALATLAELEQRATVAITTTAGHADLPVLDPTKAMRQALAADQPLWPAISDGHLKATGCALVAKLLEERLKRLGITAPGR